LEACCAHSGRACWPRILATRVGAMLLETTLT